MLTIITLPIVVNHHHQHHQNVIAASSITATNNTEGSSSFGDGASASAEDAKVAGYRLPNVRNEVSEGRRGRKHVYIYIFEYMSVLNVRHHTIVIDHFAAGSLQGVAVR